jgi:hypothetical protein
LGVVWDFQMHTRFDLRATSVPARRFVWDVTIQSLVRLKVRTTLILASEFGCDVKLFSCE